MAFITLKPRAEWRVQDKAWVTAQIRKVMASLPGVTPSFTQPIEMRVSEMLTGSRGDLAVKIFGPDLKTRQPPGGRGRNHAARRARRNRCDDGRQ